jgi:hypothetical protein
MDNLGLWIEQEGIDRDVIFHVLLYYNKCSYIMEWDVRSFTEEYMILGYFLG